MKESTAVTQLTTKEAALLKEIQVGMDEPGCGWLHEIAPIDWSPRTIAGVLGSLVKKGLVVSNEEDGCSWVELVAA
jgi:hypothetical protein